MIRELLEILQQIFMAESLFFADEEQMCLTDKDMNFKSSYTSIKITKFYNSESSKYCRTQDALST